MTSPNKTYYITTPLYYVNDVPHIGHAYTTILCDSFARFNRFIGNDVFFLTGTDEHGEKIANTAASLNKTPQDHVNTVVERFIDTWKLLGISYDDFIRTTELRHKEVVNDCVKKLIDSGDIYQNSYEGWYCVPCESFWAESNLKEGNCPDCGREVRRIEEKNYFFRLSKYQEWLIQYIEDNPDFILPKGKKSEVVSFLKEPLADLCISRPKERLHWGIPFPGDDDFVLYVWFDALLNYVSAVGYGKTEDFYNKWPADIHMMAKDILRQHAIYWPIMLKALNIEMPKHVLAHGWWTIAGDKMSKSRGNVVDPNNMSDLYGVDTFRYFMLREARLGSDGNYSENLLIERLNNDLANDLGNLVHRSIAMMVKYFGGKVPEVDRSSIDFPIKKTALDVLPLMEKAINEQFDTRGALCAVWDLIEAANKFIEDEKPWTLAKDETKNGELKKVMYTLMESIRFIGVLLIPFLPETADKIMKLLKTESKDSDGVKVWGILEAGTILEKGEPLFQKIVEE